MAMAVVIMRVEVATITAWMHKSIISVPLYWLNCDAHDAVSDTFCINLATYCTGTWSFLNKIDKYIIVPLFAAEGNPFIIIAYTQSNYLSNP